MSPTTRAAVKAHESLISVWPSAFGLARNVSLYSQTEFPAKTPLYPPSLPEIFGFVPVALRSCVCTTDKPAGGPDAPLGKKLQPSIKEQRTTQQQNSKEIPNLKRGRFRREIIAHFHSQNVQRIIREILEVHPLL